MTVRNRPRTRLRLVALAVVALWVGPLAPAVAVDTTPKTYDGAGYTPEYKEPPTRTESQNKLWFHADAWWALLLEPTGRTARVFELMPDHTWRPTSAVVNTDTGNVGDALRDGDTTHVATRGTDGALYYVRLTFDAAARDYRSAAAVLVTNRKSIAPPSIAKDTLGVMWISYATAASVVVTHSDDAGLTWGPSYQLEGTGTGETPEAVGVIAYDDRIGLLWSDQSTGSFQFASHLAGDDPRVWSREEARKGVALADNHISLVRAPGATSDTLLAAVKTSLGDQGEPSESALIEVLVRAPGGQWSAVPVSTIADGLNNPVLLVDEATRTLRLFASRSGSIVSKLAPLDDVAFASGPGDVFMIGTGGTLVDPTITKDAVDSRSGVVVLASDTLAGRYRHAELPIELSTPVVDPTDRVPPGAPASLQARALSPESVVLTWTAVSDGDRWVPAADGVPVAGYVVSRDGEEIATVSTTSFQDRPRAPDEAGDEATVEYTVQAVDAAGNRSPATPVLVDLAGAQEARTPTLIGIGLLVLAALTAAVTLAYRRFTRGPTIGPANVPEPASPRRQTPVS